MVFFIRRIYKITLFFLLIVTALLLRLFYLQAMEENKLASQSLSGRIYEMPVEVARGEILDRNGTPLTNTALHFKAILFPRYIKDQKKTAQSLSSLANEKAETILAEFPQTDHPFQLHTELDALAAKKVSSLKLPGVIVVGERMRYGYSSLASHVVGYINSADNKGVSGIEGMYDSVLRGSRPEYVAAIVDAGRRIIPGLGYKRLRMGNGAEPNNIILTIDSNIQKIVENVMDQKITKGAVVVMRPSTGEILAMASRPNFDANNLSNYLQKDTAPLMNRALAAYPPGSVFKLVIAAAALENNLVHPDDLFFDPGYIDVNHQRFRGWDYDTGGLGNLTFTEALAYSSNPVFIQTGLKIGANRLIAYAKRFGFGSRTKLDFSGEAAGNLPEPDTMYAGDLANLSIGQGSLEVTPLQIAVMLSTIVNDGIKVAPSVVRRLTAADGTTLKSYPLSAGTRIISQTTAAQLKKMMYEVTRIGTGKEAYIEGAGAAGKTGTAETGRFDANGRGINHAWFAGYTPLINPKYVIVVLVEDGMSGEDVAAPIFHAIATQILKQ
ncbi:Hypothetical protein LUCI_1227 [Lucifera butyrica]|uniref:Penicillin-binding protein transpeptidase domain-containing protein n=1 Tax=Lucifera butyrica TaxID=1351585 RepID=A0A498R0I5_9FIRM|nr:penicillin-binding protein 2 [Lucifera butyrica]VBB06016.1 Hypothetical protein LUCI_1227 [Lucifera butyrica]